MRYKVLELILFLIGFLFGQWWILPHLIEAFHWHLWVNVVVVCLILTGWLCITDHMIIKLIKYLKKEHTDVVL